MPVASPVATRLTVAALLLLTGVTGLVDSVSYLRLGRVFVANMTGNVVFIGFAAHAHSGLSPLASLVAIGGFVAGSLVGGRLAAQLAARARRWLVVAFATETALIALTTLGTATGVLPWSGRGDYATIAVLAVALGLQNSTVRHFGVPDLTTTVLTLALTGLIADSALLGPRRAKLPRRLGSVAAMLGGAAAGAALLQTSPSAVLAIAAALVGVVTLCFGVGRAPVPVPTSPPPA
jgi:uncharacterized membrane protein YoaK (UPF0700 family)